MAPAEFLVPLHHEDLEIQNKKGTYYVKPTDLDLENDASVGGVLESCVEQLAQDPTNIIEHEVFDPMFQMVRFFEGLREQHKVELVEALSSSLAALLPVINDVIQQEDAALAAEKSPKLRNALKMCLFLLSWIATSVEKASQQKAVAGGAVAGGTNNAKKKKRAPANSWNWEERQREKVAYAIRDSLEVDFGRLWKQSMVEEDFVTLFFRCGYQLLENPAIVRAEFRALRATAVGIVAKPLQRYGQQLLSSVTTAVLHMCTKYEHAATAVGELIATLDSEYKLPALGAEVIQEIGKMDPYGLSRDIGGCRNLSNLLCAVVVRAPQLVQPNLSVLMPHLNAENYPMRSALCQVVGQLILAGKNASNPSAEEEQEEQEEQESATPAAGAVTMDSATRETLLELLAERVRDKNALCRAKVMQQWCLLTSQRAVPLSFLSKLTHVGVSRLKDKSSIVRKYAVQLVTSMLEFNPFSAALKLSECERKLAELKAELGDDDEEQEEADSTSDEPTASAAADDADADADAEGDDETEAEEAVAKPEVVAAEGDEGAVAMLQRKVDFYTAAVSFIKSVHYAMDTVTELLDSKSLTDVQEAINFIVVADAFKVEKSKQGIRKMMLLIWSKDVAIKSAVITAYKTLFLARPIENVPRQQRAAAVARSLIGLTMGANLGELTSLEEIVTDLMAQGLIKDSTVGALWNIFGSQSRQQSEGALSILSMAANADPKVVEANLGMLIALGLKTSDSAAGNRLAKQTCVALQKLEPTGAQLPPSHQLFEHLRSVLLVDDDTVAPGSRAAFDRTWFPAAEQAINTAFVLCTQPEEFCTNVLRDLSSGERLWRNGGKSLSKRGLCRVLFVVGHVAVKHFVFIETTSTQIKKEEDEKENVQKKKEQSRGTPGSPRGLGAELGISNAIDEGEIEAIREMAEREILGERNTIGMYAGLITSLCGLAYRQAGEQPVAASLDEHVRESAVLALCKLMCVGAEYCEPNLQLLFTILNKDTSPRVRANIIIALGDLSFRFPNMLEPWCPHFFARLNDRDLTVRKHTLMALTHLILNDMIKVRAQVSDIALCLEDEAPRMRDLARMFFHELAHKGTNNPIYNYLPDIIGRLSHNADVGTEKFQRIVKFLMSYIEKDKQAEGLVEKLCHRFRGTHELTQWRDIAHCLSVLNYSDRATKKVVELFKCYGDKLADGQVYESFQTIVTKCRKFCKSETKGLLDEFETKLTETHTQAARDLAATQKAERASKTGKTSPMKIKTPSPEEIAEEQESTAMGDKEGEKEANDGEAGEESEEEESGEEDEEEEEEEGSEEEGSEEESSEEESEEEEEEEEEEEIDVSKLKVAELKAHLRKLGLSEAGLKAVLVKRLKKALSEPPAPKAKAKSAPNGKAHAKGRSGKALAEVN